MTELQPIKIHNSLACAKYSMNTTEQKLFIFAVRNLNQDNDNFTTSRFNISDFARYADLDTKRLYKDVKAITDNILKTLIHIQDKSNPDKWSTSVLAIKCNYNKGELTFRFNDEMKPLLLQLQEHYFLQSPSVIKFKSWYSIRIYDLLKSKSYKSDVVVIPLDDLRTFLCLEEKYERFNNFRARVLDVPIKEINESSDIKITYETIYSGKSVVSIEFSVARSDNAAIGSGLWGILDIGEFREKTKLTKEIFSSSQLENLYGIAVKRFKDFKTTDEIYLYMKMCYSYAKKMKPEGNLLGYYRDVLMNDYPKAIVQIKTGYFI